MFTGCTLTGVCVERERVATRPSRFPVLVLPMESVLCFVACCVAFSLWCCIHRLRQWGKPGIKSWPLLGASLQVSANYDRIYDWTLENMRDLGCSSVVVPMLRQSYVFTVDPINVEHILKSNFSNYPKGSSFHEKFVPLLGNGIFNSDGEAWRIQRKTASLDFGSKVLKDFSTELFKEYALKLANIVAKAVSTGKILDIQDLFMRMTLDSICKFGFGTELGVLDPGLPENIFATAFDRCNEILSHRFADPAWKIKRFFGLGLEGELHKHVKSLDTFTYGIIQTRRARLLQDKPAEAQHCDLLSRFMSLDMAALDRSLRDMILNFIIAGRDTTANTLSWFLYRVASDPRVGKNIYKELLEFQRSSRSGMTASQDLGESLKDFSELLTYEALSKLPYLQASIMETLRLHPAVPLNFKGVTQSDVLPDGTSVEKGDLVCYSPWCMGRMESLWGSDAEEFRPERWFKNGEWDFNVSPFTFTAFQAGPRICLGKDSAFLQMKVTTAILCRFFSFEIVPGQATTYRVMATMSIANGLKVRSKILSEDS